MAEIHKKSNVTGNKGEAITAYYLEKSGYKILSRNFRIRGGEIDIIAEKDGTLAFVEVKTRSSYSLDPGEYAVDKRKKRLIINASQEFIFKNGIDVQPRYDVASVVIQNGKIVRFDYYDNAFSADEIDTIF